MGLFEKSPGNKENFLKKMFLQIICEANYLLTFQKL